MSDNDLIKYLRDDANLRGMMAFEDPSKLKIDLVVDFKGPESAHQPDLSIHDAANY
ncbi:hypothetical protein BH10CYA1_BH10CYA1_22330 [soil metagenome]